MPSSEGITYERYMQALQESRLTMHMLGVYCRLTTVHALSACRLYVESTSGLLISRDRDVHRLMILVIHAHATMHTLDAVGTEIYRHQQRHRRAYGPSHAVCKPKFHKTAGSLRLQLGRLGN